MKTLMLISLYGFDRIGGTEKAITNLANILCEKYRILLLSCYSPQKSIFYELDERIDVMTVSMPEVPTSFFGKIAWNYCLIKKMRKLVLSQKISCIIGTNHAINSMLPFVTLGRKIRLVGCEHAVYNTIHFPFSFIRRMMYPFLDAVVVLTSTSSKHYEYHHGVYIIPNFIKCDGRRSKLTTNTILSIGRYDDGKNFEDLIKVATILRERQVEYRFFIVGNGEQRTLLEKMVLDMKLMDRVYLLPPTKDVQSLYLAASIYAMTSKYEALPMVLLEAKSFGLPIVSYACEEGPLSLIRDGYDGFLIETGDVVAFADKVQCLLSDNRLRKNVSDHSYKSVIPYSKENVTRAWIQLLQYLIGE